MSVARFNDKPVAEGYIAGISSLIVALVWAMYSPFDFLVIFPIFMVALFCISISTIWTISGEETVSQWIGGHYSRITILVFVEFILIVLFYIFSIMKA